MKAIGVAICGENAVFPARVSGCAEPIMTHGEVYRCTDCDIPFHKECAKKHFDNHVFTEDHLASMTEEEIDKAYSALTPNAGIQPSERSEDRLE